MGKKLGNSLQDQLLKAGLTNEKKIKQVKDQQYKKKKSAKKTKQSQVDEGALAIEKERKEKQERDRLLNRQKDEAAKAKAIIAQIHQLIDMNRVNTRGEIKYNFSHEKKVKFITVNDAVQRDLSLGRLGIVLDRDGRYAVVPAGVIEKITARDSSYVVSLHEKEATTESSDASDDPYADFQVPDDLMW